MSDSPSTPRVVWTTVGVVAGVILAVIPVSMIGASAFLIRDDFPFAESQIGLVAALFFATVSLLSYPSGVLVERIGDGSALRLVAWLTAVGSAGLGLATYAFWHMVVFLIIGGMACSIAIPAGSSAIAALRTRHTGTLIGLHQGAAPLAGLVAGIALPVVAVPFGWRTVFVVSSITAFASGFMHPSTWRMQRDTRRRDALTNPAGRQVRPLPNGLVLLSVAIGLGAGPGISGGIFIVDSLITAGQSPTFGGLLLAVSSLMGAIFRIGLPSVAQRLHVPVFLFTAVLFLIAGTGYLFFATASTALTFIIGAFIGYGIGYGWSGVAYFGVVQAVPYAPARAIGKINTGSAGGAGVGPLAFGTVASIWSYPAAWTMAGVTMLVAAVLMVIAGRRLTQNDAA